MNMEGLVEDNHNDLKGFAASSSRDGGMEGTYRRGFGELRLAWLCVLVLQGMAAGCYAPLHAPAMPASQLPASFRTPARSQLIAGRNLATLAAPQQTYRLGTGDVLEVTIPNLTPGTITPLRVEVTDEGHIYLPSVGPVQVAGVTLDTAHRRVHQAYADGVLRNPSVSISLAEKVSVAVVVLGEVQAPGVHRLPRGENDVAHALAAAGGLTEYANDWVEVHHGVDPAAAQPVQELPPNRLSEASFSPQSGPLLGSPRALEALQRLPEVGTPIAQQTRFSVSAPEVMEYVPLTVPATNSLDPMVTSIPLRGLELPPVDPQQVVLQAGDIVKVPRRPREVFYVVGKLSTATRPRFGLDEREREIGSGYLLPRDRDIDVVTAVAMAGYIDPIDSPTTVTVHRSLPDRQPLLVKVDLIRARYDPQENILVQPGDIIYLNPDAAWWLRRTFNGVINRIIGSTFDLRVLQ